MKLSFMFMIGTILLVSSGCNLFEDPISSNQTPAQTTKFALSITSTHGSVTLNPTGGTYDSGSIVTLTPTADSGYMFSSWSGDLSGAITPATITMNSRKSVNAVFSTLVVGIHGTITIDTVWNKPLEDYHINGDLTINANVTWGRKIKVRVDDGVKINVNGSGKLTIEEGVEVKLGTGSYLSVGYSTAGTLIAKGSDSLMVTFTKGAGVQNWGYAGSNEGGIILNNKTTDLTSIDHCIIEHATCGISVQGIPAVITNCKIRSNKDLGIDFVSPAAPKDSASFINDSITGNGGYPISICPEGLTSLSGDSYLGANIGEGILVVGGGNVTKSGTWKKHSVPYVFDIAANLGSATGTTITIQPGVTCKFNTSTYIQVGYSNSATLIADGTDTLPITFTKKTGVQNWGSANAGIILWDKTTNQTIFDHCIIEYATSGIYILSLPAVITHCKIQNNAKYGIDFTNKAMPKDSASFIGDSITGNGSFPITMIAEGLTRLSGDTYMKDNTPDLIEVTGGNVTQSGTWKRHNVSYLFTAQASLGSATGTSITINPGAECKFAANTYLQVGYSNSATLIAEGTALDSIRFTKATSGTNWGSATAGLIIWEKATQNTSLKYCVIDSATAGIYVWNTKLTISNCSIRDNTGSGIFFNANASPKDSASFIGNTITGNGDFPIKIYASHLGSLSGTGTFLGNLKHGIFVTGSAVKEDATWKNHYGTVPYIVDGKIDIGSATGATVTIRPHTRFEFTQNSHISIGYSSTGTLIADAYPVNFDGDQEDIVLEAIIFTSHIDGAFWGASSYAGINMWEGTTGTTIFRNCEIQFATGGVFYNTKTDPTIRDCFITRNQTYGIAYYNTSIPHTNVHDNFFQDNATDTLYLH